MFILESIVKIGSYEFRSVHDIEISKSVDKLSDSCVIKLPSRFKVQTGGAEKYTENAIKVGDKVSVTLGYKNVYKGIEFTGYVRKIKPATPLTIECEDAIYLLRKNNINWTKEKTTLKEVLLQTVKGTELKLSDNIIGMNIDKWVIRNANGAQVLEGLKKELRVSSFVDDEGKLYCGLEQSTNVGEVAKYDLNYNIVVNDLEYRTAEDRRIKIEYKYKSKDNSERVVSVGDTDGELRTFHTSVVSDISQLTKMAKAELEKLKYDGMEGSITSFLLPYATRGMTAQIIDKEHREREGRYFIEEVIMSFGTNGARRKVKLGRKI